jgi:HAD superfamily 5'-nucleotidase-like hydrolase
VRSLENKQMIHSLHPIRPLDLSMIEAVGFDLDHTLALYDDDAVNRLAAEETIHTLKFRGYSLSSLPGEITASAARGLSMDLMHGNILKISASGRVKLARCGPHWLSRKEIEEQYGDHDPADEATTWHVNSPFDAPTLWFFSMIGAQIHGVRDTAHAAQVLKDIRTSLDESHTRGELKKHIARDLARFVSPAGNVVAGLERWKNDGKRLFVVTNSDPAFAGKILDHVIGRQWRELFDFVFTDAGKPRFFVGPTEGVPGARDARDHVVDRGHASLVEERLGLPGERILYAGDNARADIAPARRRGWRTAHIVAELEAGASSPPWAGALEHEGEPTWFARTVHDHADLACARIDALLASNPRALIASDEPFFERIMRAAGSLRPSGDDP